jgi:hypothetical protein
MQKVKLLIDYTDKGYTCRSVPAGTKGEAYPFDALGDLWKVKVKDQHFGNGEISVRKKDLEFLQDTEQNN